MLPTTGHFKNFNCPFYESCICERPYCHFKHSKRETVNDTNLISELVSKAVHKVLNSNISAPEGPKRADDSQSAGVAGINVTYNPTPISELNKYKNSNSSGENHEKKSRHIPIQYTPERPRPSRSLAPSYANSIDYNVDEYANSNVGYSPTPNTYSSVSYVPSSIKTLAGNSTANSDSGDGNSLSSESKNQPYVPVNINSSDSSSYNSSVPIATYSPTRNLRKPPITTYSPDSESVPKYSDDFIDEFLNDPSIFESPESALETKTVGTEEKPGSNSNAAESISSNKPVSSSKKCDDVKPEKSNSHHSLSSSSKHSGSKSDSSSKSSSSKHSDKKRSEHKSKSRETNGHSHKHSSSKSNSDKHSKSYSDKHSSSSSKSKSSSKLKTEDSGKSRSSDRKVKHSDREKSSDKSRTKNKKESADNKIKEEIKVEDDKFSFMDADDYSEYESESELEQCKRIFLEYQPPKDETVTIANPKPSQSDALSVASTSKKRIAHEKSSNIVRDTVAKPVLKKSAAEVMAIRYKKVLSTSEQKQPTSNDDTSLIKPQLVEVSDKSGDSKQILKRPVAPPDKNYKDTAALYPIPAKMKRIAHVPNVSSLLNAKKKMEEITKTKEVNKTPSQTITKGGKRVAHIPEVSIADIPTVLQAEKSKLPLNVRNRYLFLMVKECTKLYVSKQAAYERALNEELNCYSKCSAIATYRNSVMLCISRLRKESESGQLLNGSSALSSNASEFSGEKLYKNVSKWILSEEELLENGYPRPGAVKKGYALFKETKQTERIPENSQLCVRCKKIYVVDEEGYALYPEDCIYHPGSRFVFRGETKYICCKESSASTGCCICSTHVFEIRDPSNLSGFVCTFEPERADDARSIRVYALDCEMVYTTRGFELARVTIIDDKCDVVYESMVKPFGNILDCNTRFSGLTSELLKNVSTRITEVQATLLLMFNSKTILIGHSLESDLKALRLIHSTVIDTSVLFPHKMGPPKKRGLRGLASDILKKIIQNDEGGHDSAEDAITCMELIMWKLKEELKTR